MNDYQKRQSLGGRLAQARQRGDAEMEREALQDLAELRVKMCIDEHAGHLTAEAVARLHALMSQTVVAA